MDPLARFDDLERWSPRAALTLALVAGVGFATFWFLVWPTDVMWDDGGIVLRYMDHFADGHPYRYNVNDPPVFGVSGFVHATLAGAVAATRLVSPENSLHASGFLGIVLSCVAMLMVLRQFSSSLLAIVTGWVFVVSACYYFLINAYQGLEAPLHLGIVLLACWAWLAGRWQTMWALMAFSIISKLDAVPVVVVLLASRATQLRSRADWFAEIRRAALWGGLPLLAWVVFATAYFGSPLPQSAAAKLEHHMHPPRPTDFVLDWWKRDEVRIGIYWAFVAAGIVAAVRGSAVSLSRVLVLPLGSLAVLGLYLIYNPGERMSWYYVLPQALLALGAVAGFLAPLRERSWRVASIAAVVVLVGALPTNVATSGRQIRGSLEYIFDVEPERMAVGDFVYRNAAPEDRLLTGHGYVARYARIHTHDRFGLNSPEVTRIWEAGRDPIDDLHPDWVAEPGRLSAEQQARLGYRLEATFYDRSVRGHPAWRVWQLAPGPVAVAVDAGQIVAGTVEGDDRRLVVSGQSDVRLALSGDPSPEELEFGLIRQGSDLRLTVLGGDRMLADAEVPARDPEDRATGRAAGFRIPISGASAPLTIRVTGMDGSLPDEPFVVLEPLWLIPRETGAR